MKDTYRLHIYLRCLPLSIVEFCLKNFYYIEEPSKSVRSSCALTGFLHTLVLSCVIVICTRNLLDFIVAKSHLFLHLSSKWMSLTCFSYHENRNDGTEFGGSIYQRVNEKIETSINLAWTAGSNNTRFGIAAKYRLDCRTSLSVSAVRLDPACKWVL